MTKEKFIETYTDKAVLFRSNSDRDTFVKQIENMGISSNNINDYSFKKDFNVTDRYMIFNAKAGLRRGLISEILSMSPRQITVKGLAFYDPSDTVDTQKFEPKRRDRGEIVEIDGEKAIVLNVCPDKSIEISWVESATVFKQCSVYRYLETSKDTFKIQ